VTDLYVDFEHKGKGHASQIMDQVETWLRERKRPGIIVESILDGDPAHGMYERRGWRPVPNSFGQHVYNWPDDVDLSILDGYPQRYTDHLERGSN
jgi:GNAT superfamily N-acetyltransferase